MPNWNEIIEKLDYAFQPIIYSHTGKIYAVEALVRGVQNIDGLNSIDDLFDKAFNDDFLYELDLQLREKAISKFSNIEIENLKIFYNLDNKAWCVLLYKPLLRPKRLLRHRDPSLPCAPLCKSILFHRVAQKYRVQHRYGFHPR